MPSIGRPGRFVEWIGWVPVLCEWGGLISRSSMELRAIDPAQRWLTSSGYRSLYDARYVSGNSGVRALFRHVLSNMATSKGFDLIELGEHAREAAANQLALPENEWLRQALKAGPVDPLPLPSRLWAVQTSLFAA